MTKTKDPQTIKKKTTDLQPALMTILGLDTSLHKKSLCKLAILHINRMIKFRKIYLLEERHQEQMGKRHWSWGWVKTSDGTWDQIAWIEERELNNFDCWLINWLLMVEMLLRLTSHKNLMIKILKTYKNKNLI